VKSLPELVFVAVTGHCHLTLLKCMNSDKLELSFCLTTYLQCTYLQCLLALKYVRGQCFW